MADNLTLADIAAVTERDGFGGGSSWWIIVFLIFAMMGGNGWGNNGLANAVSQADLQRAIDLNSIQQGQAGIGSDIQRTTYETIAAVKDSAYNNLGEIRDIQGAIATGFANQQSCCCETQRAIDGVNYNGAINTANITAAIHAEGEQTRALMQQNKIETLQAQVNNLQLQSQLAGVVRYPMASTFSMSNPYCGCNNAY